LPIRAWVEWGGLAVPFTVSRRSRRQGLRVRARWRPGGRRGPLTAALRRAGAGSGQFRPSNRSTTMAQLSFSSFDSLLLVRDAKGRYLPASVDQILSVARQAIDQKYQRGALFDAPDVVKTYLTTKLVGFEHEVFAALFLDSKHRLLEYVELFRGTIDQASVYPREVVKEALRVNAAAVIFSHNHPSGNPEPSQADKVLTRRLKEALELVEVRTLDHIVVGGEGPVSFAEQGLL